MRDRQNHLNREITAQPPRPGEAGMNREIRQICEPEKNKFCFVRVIRVVRG